MKNILIIVDMQSGFTQQKRLQKLTKNIANLLKKNIFDIVIATRFLNHNDSIYEKLLDWHRLKGEIEQQIDKNIKQYIDITIDKNIYNCVNESFIKKLCLLNDGKKPKNIFIAGVDTDCCVLVIATSLFENGIRPIVLTKYCNSNGGKKSHKAGLLCLKRLIGTKQLISARICSKKDLNRFVPNDTFALSRGGTELKQSSTK